MKKNSTAFTLLELLLAVTIFAVIATALYSSFFAGIRIFRRAQVTMEFHQDIRLVTEELAFDLRNSLLCPLHEESPAGEVTDEEEEEPEPDNESEPESRPVFDTPEGLQDIMEKAGLADIRIFSEGRDFIYATKEEFWSTLWSHGFRRILEMIENEKGEEGLQKFKAEVFAKMGSMMRSDGFYQSIGVHFGLAIKPKD